MGDDKCFACDKKLKAGKEKMVETSDGQTVYVGSECYRRIKVTGPKGYQPPKGGPRLFDSWKQ
jgi:hypothetical protein